MGHRAHSLGVLQHRNGSHPIIHYTGGGSTLLRSYGQHNMSFNHLKTAFFPIKKQNQKTSSETDRHRAAPTAKIFDVYGDGEMPPTLKKQSTRKTQHVVFTEERVRR